MNFIYSSLLLLIVKIKCYYTITTCCISQCPSSGVVRSCVSLLHQSKIGITVNLCIYSSVTIQYSKFQCYYTVTTCCISQCPCSRIVRRCVRYSIYPCVGITVNLCIYSSVTVIDYKIQCYYTVTTCCISQCPSSSVVRCSVSISINPSIGITMNLYINSSSTIQNSKIKCYYTVTSCCISQCPSSGVVRCSVSYSIYPGVGVTVNLCIYSIIIVING